MTAHERIDALGAAVDQLRAEHERLRKLLLCVLTATLCVFVILQAKGVG